MSLPGPRNLLTDVPGLAVGNAGDETLLSGVTVILPERESVMAVDVRGGAPASRETDALAPDCLVEKVHGLVLSGGSVFGLDAASGAVHWLAGRGAGFTFRDQPWPCPVVPSACLFDLTNGGDKAWGRMPPYRALAMEACEAAGSDFALGNAGAGLGALAGRYKGGLGSASIVDGEVTLGALVAVNAFGSPVVPGTRQFWAAPWEIAGEFGGAGTTAFAPREAGHSLDADTKLALLAEADRPGRNTTIGLVATDVALTKAEAKRIAVMAADGMARAIRPVHTPFDGDIVFAMSTGKRDVEGPRPLALMQLGALAADCMARAVARGVWHAETVAQWRSYRDIHGR